MELPMNIPDSLDVWMPGTGENLPPEHLVFMGVYAQ